MSINITPAILVFIQLMEIIFNHKHCFFSCPQIEPVSFHHPGMQYSYWHLCHKWVELESHFNSAATWTLLWRSFQRRSSRVRNLKTFYVQTQVQVFRGHAVQTDPEYPGDMRRGRSCATMTVPVFNSPSSYSECPGFVSQTGKQALHISKTSVYMYEMK